MKRRKREYWTKEKCKEEALKYKTKIEWIINSHTSYKKSRKNGWFDELCNHMKRPIVWNKNKKYSNSDISKIWTKETCTKVGKDFTTKTEFRRQYPGAYKAAYKNNWLDDICINMILSGNNYKRLIYSFEFPNNSVYVGLTCNSKRRKNEHFNEPKSQVYRYIRKTNLQPKYYELTDYIHKFDAISKEGEFIEKYKNTGWIILNKKRSGDLGGANLIWTKEKCREEALKYETKYEWRTKSPKSYAAAYKRNCLNECTNHMIVIRKNKGYWTLDNCIEDAKNYKTRSEWYKNSSGYGLAHKNNWLDICCKHMKIKIIG